MIWVGILGAKGYLGEELSKLVAGHRSAQLSTMMDELCAEDRSIDDAVKKSDIIFNGLSGTMAENIYSRAISYGKRIIDIGDQHAASVYPGSVYGLSELYRDKMQGASIAANPSSYCTGAMLGLVPLAAGDLVDLSTAVIESKSGISCLECGDKLTGTDMTINGGTRIYKMESSGYAEEVNEQMLALFGKKAVPSYTSYVIPGIKGIITTIKASPHKGFCGSDILEAYKNFYNSNPLIEVCSAGKCFCRISVSEDADTGKITVTTVLDDAVKGAASQAIQTMNLMFGIDGKIGL
ncbi:MAG: hypothetical protein VB106_20690 [Clostridiaceae bacterium]|jgi:N-acetyl-gamma-glutamyl-phosphate reductase|nr:hypothetical protein [Clostridiaceae bacterium]